LAEILNIMWKKHKILVLPTDKVEKGTILYAELKSQGYSKDYWGINKRNDSYPYRHLKPQHLYILDDTEIKEDCFIYMPKDGLFIEELFFAPLERIKEIRRTTGRKIYKVIATTDKSLDLPSISNEFLQEWVNNPVDEIEVEKERIYSNSQNYKDYYCTTNKKLNCRFIQTEDTWDDIFNEWIEEDILGKSNWMDWLKENYEVPKKK
jgi:hypothetical protein